MTFVSSAEFNSAVFISLYVIYLNTEVLPLILGKIAYKLFTQF